MKLLNTVEIERKRIEIASYEFCQAQVQLEAYNMAVCNINEGRKDDLVEKMADRFDPQFRDTDVAKDDAGKTEEAKQRYYARKILKDRGLLPQAGKPVVKREVSKDMIRQSVQGGRS